MITDMKKLLMIAMACYGQAASAQGLDYSKNFIYLNSDSVIYADRITLRPDLTGAAQLRADSRRVPMSQVKFFNNEDGFFANTRKQTFTGETAFAERTIEGRINLFQPVVYHRSYDVYNYGRRQRYREDWSRGQAATLYYNKGLEDLKKVNYHNLQKDMIDNAVSMDLLDGYRKSMRASTVLYTAAGASIVAALATFVASSSGKKKDISSPPDWWSGTQGRPSSIDSSRQNFTASFILLGAGLGFAVGGFSTQLSGSRKLENALDAYNR